MGKIDKSVIRAAGGILWKTEGDTKKIAVVHRHKYQDWSLPKGKVEPGESWIETARREVLEETGCVGEITNFAGSVSYVVNGKPKIVLYWHMDIQGEKPESMNGEVDKIRWLVIEEAVALLDYPGEIELIQRGPIQQ